MKKFLITIPIILILLLLTGYMLFNSITDRIIEESLDGELFYFEEETPIQQSSSSTEEIKDKPTEPSIQKNTTKASTNTNPTIETSYNKVEKLTKQQVQNIKENITTVDKKTIVDIVLSKLTSADVKELTALAAGGLTAEERARAKQIAYSRFTQSEINEIKELYYKYISNKE